MSVNGLNLRKLRQAVGIGQVELAERVGVSQGMISQLELGCRSCRPDTLEIIAAELKCSVEDLTGQPAVWIQFMRNCKRLSNAQLEAINEVVSQLIKCSPAEQGEAASTSTNTQIMPCSCNAGVEYIPQSVMVCSKCGAEK
jgi:transcriptional regulator with XRE-family HTH domain